MNIEHRTSNIEHRMGKDEETEIAVECSVLAVCFFIRCLDNLKSVATSLFDVRRSMFDVGRSSFKTTPYGINATCKRLQNNLALMGKGGVILQN